jgi:hypothetical protein
MTDSEDRVELAEAEKVPAVEVGEEVRPRRRGILAWLPPRFRKPLLWGVVATLTGLFIFLVASQYLRLARMTDELLAEGPFSSSTDILAAPETIATGDALTPEGLAGKLERAGYSRSPHAGGNSYEMQSHAVQILPGAGSSADRVRVEFAQGKIAVIVSLRKQAVSTGSAAAHKHFGES